MRLRAIRGWTLADFPFLIFCHVRLSLFFYHHDNSPLQSGHAFYVDTRSKPPRSIWQHPYDDPTYLQSLPDTHPANPNSTEAKQARSKYDEMMDKARKEREMKQQEKRSTGGKLKDKLLGSTKAEREEKRRKKAALRAKQEEEERVSFDRRVSSLISFCFETQML
jgi:hypothetical protein